MSIEELEVVPKAHSDNLVLFPESILHTDSAKAYNRVGPMKWPRPGAHVFAFEGTPPFSQFHYARTNVCHKKVGVNQEFVALPTVRLFSGEDRDVLGGTQKIDGLWASMRRYVGEISANTGDTETAKRDLLNAMVRVFQWHWWNLKADRFRMFGELIAKHRDDALDACPESF